MSRTRHFKQRMSRRGITLDLVDLACHFGEPNRDKVVLGRKSLTNLLAGIRQLERTAKRALDKGGVIVIEDGETLITTYNFNSFDRRKVASRKRDCA